jgi:uncharacterized protein involved in exopolysaccharide biosynthesis
MSVTTRDPFSQGLDDSFGLDGPSVESLHGNVVQESYSDNHFRSLTPLGGISKFIEPLVIYRNCLIGSVLASILLGWLALVIWPRAYESTSKLQLLVGRESVGLDPSSTTSQTMLLQKTPEEDVNSALEILGSRTIAEEVVDDIGYENVLNGFLPSTGEPQAPGKLDAIKSAISSTISKAYSLSGLRDPISQRERAVTELMKKTSVFAPKKSSTLIIEHESKSPQMAQAIVQSMVANFLEKHVNVGTTDGSFRFFESQSAETEAKLMNLLDKRKMMLQAEKIASVDSKHKSLTEQLSAIETEILKSEAQLRKTTAEIADIQTNMSKLDPDIIASLQTQPDQTLTNMQTALYKAELEEKRLSELYQDNNPKLLAIRQQVAAARQSLNDRIQTSDSVSKTPNPTLLKLEAELMKAKTTSAGLTSFLEQNESQRKKKLDEINRLLEFDNSLRQLDREIEVESKSLATLKEKEEQARVIEELRQKRISSVSIAQPPSFVEKPVSPKKPILAGAFLSLGLLSGLGLVGLREFTRRTMRRPEEVERLMKYPVLTELPQIRALMRDREPNPMLLRSRRSRAILDACQGIQSELMLHPVLPADVSRISARTIGVIGISDGCGASSIAMALAIVCCEEGIPTTLVDLDSKKGTISKGFGLAVANENPRSRRRRNPAALPSQLVTEEGLRLIGCNSPQCQKLVQCNSEEVCHFLEDWSRTNEFMIVDLPPASRPGNAIAITQHLDQIIVVIESDRTETKAAIKLIAQLESANAEVVGVVINKSRRNLARWIEGVLG